MSQTYRGRARALARDRDSLRCLNSSPRWKPSARRWGCVRRRSCRRHLPSPMPWLLWGSRRMSRGRCQRGLRHLRRRLISLVLARAEQPPAPKPAATMPVSTSAPSAKALGKRKTTDVAEPQRASKQPKLRCDCRRDKVAVQQEGARPGSSCAEGRRGHRLQ